ncbi:MAG: large repetitive protein [Candidatus Cloacimonadota bacterium]|nr:large repetitive protein [Candidatus Cloacimonadota bacterium]
MKRSLAMIALMLCFLSLWGQNDLSQYTFSYSVEQDEEIMGGTLLGNTTTDNQYFVNPVMTNGSTLYTQGSGFPIGFDFSFAGQIYDRVGINANGWIALGKSSYGEAAVNMFAENSHYPLSSESNELPHEDQIARIAGFARDLQAQAQSSIRILSRGAAPNRELIVQWKNYRRQSATGDSYNFQIRLQEHLMKVSVIYLTMQTASAAASEVGLRAAPADAATNFATRTTSLGWANSTAGAAANSTAMLSSTNYPVPGATFTWSPLISSSIQSNFCAEPLSGPAPLLVQFTDLSTYTSYPIVNWIWEIGGDIVYQQNPIYCFNTPGLYSISLTVSDAMGGSSSLTRDNYIEVLPSELPGLNTYIQMQGHDAVISWDPITTDEAGNSFTPDYYFLYFNGSNTFSEDFYFLAPIPYPQTTFTHEGVALGADHMMYRVKAIQLED